MLRSIVGVAACLLSGASALELQSGDSVLNLNLPQDAVHQDAFKQVYNEYLEKFDVDAHQKLMEDLEAGLENYKNSVAFNGFKTVPSKTCDAGAMTSGQAKAMTTKAMTPFPGGVVKRVFGFDLSKLMYELSQKASGPAAAAGGMGGILAMQALSMGAGMVQTAVSTAVHYVPPMIPPFPPALTCMPMVTGHNCFGAVLYPITMADFVIADQTDAMMDGYIASFPNTYATKVGKTDDASYKRCFAAAMSMQCSSIFPMCSNPMGREEPGIGRVPMCFHMCISTLIMCPGFWVEDIMGPCQTISVPPMCSMAVYWNLWRLPPQYTSFEDSEPAALECPKTDISFGADASSDFDLYDTSATAGASPYMGAGVKSLPVA